MRKLTAGQKKILEAVLNTYKSVYSYDDLPDGIKLDLCTINDFETIVDDTNRFIWDFNAKKMAKGGF